MTARSKRDTLAALTALPPLRVALERLGRWRGALVLTYHRIGDPTALPWDQSLWSSSAGVFDEHLTVLAADCEVLTPADLLDFASLRRPGRRVLITFDDGYRDNFELAYPLLLRHRLSATFFITTGFLDQRRPAWWDEIAWMVRHASSTTLRLPERLGGVITIERERPQVAISALTSIYKRLPAETAETLLDEIAERTAAGRCPRSAADELWMTWDNVREMHAHGMQIGGHTVTHPLLGRCSVERQEQEISRCACRLEEVLGQPMRWFAYPVGSADAYNDTTARLLREHDIQLAFTLSGRLCSTPEKHPLCLDRVAVSYHHTARVVRATTLVPAIFTRL